MVRLVAVLRAAAWVLYDLANTVYAATVTFLFAPYASETLGYKAGIGIVQTVSMVLAGLLVPLAGALADRTGRTRRYLAVTTLLCIAAMAGWALPAPWLLLPCFLLANVTYNLALVFYNAMLPQVAPPHRTGLLSGIGVGVGYFGTILVLLLLLRLPETSQRFGLAAVLFLVGALPCLLLVRDRRGGAHAGPAATAGPAAAAAWNSLRTVLRELPRHRPLLLFLLANFCLVDVLNTAVLFFADFTLDVFRGAVDDGSLRLFGHAFAGAEGRVSLVQLCGLVLNALALCFGLGLGFCTDRAPLGTMRVSAIALLLALCGGALFGGGSLLGYLATLVALGAFGLAGIWTAGRKVVLLLAPPLQVGTYFGLYGITNKLSVVGSTTYSLLADHFGAKPALLGQSLQLVLGLVLLSLVRLPAPRDAAAQR